MALILDFRNLQFAEEPERLNTTLDLQEELTQRSDVKAARPFQVQFQAQMSADLAVVNGEYIGEVDLLCSRCVCQFTEKMHIQMAHLFTQKQEIVEQDPDDEIELIEEDQIDLIPYAEEDILLSVPLFPLCKSDCKGLCAKCGQDYNEGTCECNHETIDPRLEKLKKFFD